jgi:dihydrofolate synthase/folylpolyglutamate synthase
MTYREALAYLDSFINYELLLPVLPKKPFDLRRIEQFLASVGDPHKKLRCIHVAGTKGKGSTCAFIAAILQRAGYRVGLYTSPHLSSFRERIRILDRKSVFSRLPPFEGAVSSSDFSRVLSELQPKLESFRKQPVGRELTFFEVLTVLAFVYFAGQSVDFVVLETGLGGRLDATNVVESLACCITPISYEHTALLGSTLGAIAKEKAGIIKGVRPSVVSAPQEKEAEAVITERCRRLHAKLLAVGDHIVYERAGIAREREVFHVSVLKRRYRGLTTQLVGRHQLVNACVALGAIEALRGNGIRVTERAVRSGLARTFWPAPQYRRWGAESRFVRRSCTDHQGAPSRLFDNTCIRSITR